MTSRPSSSAMSTSPRAGRGWTDACCSLAAYAIDRTGRIRGVLPKVYVEARVVNDRVTEARLIEVQGPPPLPGRVPGSIFEILPRVRPLLDAGGQPLRVPQIPETTHAPAGVY